MALSKPSRARALCIASAPSVWWPPRPPGDLAALGSNLRLLWIGIAQPLEQIDSLNYGLFCNVKCFEVGQFLYCFIADRRGAYE
jgi:hypothetical protein